MKTVALWIGVTIISVVASGQMASPAVPTPQAPTAAGRPSDDLGPLLPQIQETAQNVNLEVARLRIDKWKADASVKRQVQSDADSITRNLTNAFPVVLEQSRSHPQSLAAAFKLYRNLDALYEVFNGLTEATGTFGPRTEYESLSAQATTLSQLRRALGDKLETLASGSDGEVIRLRADVAARAAAVPPPPPAKIVVDDEEKPRKAVRKKPAKSSAPDSSHSSPPTSKWLPKLPK